MKHIALILVFASQIIQLNGQCSNCTNTISSNQTNLTVSSGVVCIQAGVTISGAISLSNGATICNNGIINASSITVNTSQTANIINYGTINSDQITWGTNAQGQLNNYGSITCNGLNLGYHNGYNVNFTNHPNANLTVNCVAYLLAGTFIFNGNQSMNCPIYFSGSNSTVNAQFNTLFQCTNSISFSAGNMNISVGSNGTLRAFDITINDDALFTNNGLISTAGNFIVQMSPGESITFNQNNRMNIRGSSSSSGLNLSNVGGSLTFNNSGVTSVQNRLTTQGAQINMNGYNIFSNDLYLLSSTNVSTTLNCGGRFWVTGMSILQTSTFGANVDLCDSGGGWDAMQGTNNGSICVCNGQGTQGSYLNFNSTNACPCINTTSNIQVNNCGPYTLNGQTYTQSGTYTQIRSNTAGCDSTITLQLTVRQPSSSSISQTSCNSITINNQTYTQSGTYTQILQNAVGCDSTLTLILTIRQSSSSIVNQIACQSFTLNNQTYTQSGTYTQILQNAQGCDSTITLNLTIGQTTFGNLSLSGCGLVIHNNQTYTQTGTYFQNRLNYLGCDSLITLQITINPLPNISSSADTSHCGPGVFSLSATGGTQYLWSPANGLNANNVSNPIATVSQTTWYYVSVTDQLGCRSVDSTLITINSIPNISVSGNTICSGQCATLTAIGASTYTWSGVNLSSNSGTTVTACPSKTNIYTVRGTTSAGCSSVLNFTLQVNPRPYVELGPNKTVCLGTAVVLDAGAGAQSYAWNNGATGQYLYPQTTGNYSVTVTNSFGCSSSDAVRITFRRCRATPVTILPRMNQDVDITEYDTEEKEWKGDENLNDSQIEDLTIFPNPARDFFQIQSGLSEDNQNELILEIADLTGRQWKTEWSRDNNQIIVQTKELPSGTYLLRILSGNKIYQSKVVLIK